MKTFLDCIPCFVRQSLDAARLVSPDPAVHEDIIRDLLRLTSEIDLDQPPPVMGQRIYRRLREITSIEDPYRAAKDHQNRLAMNMLPEMRAQVETSSDPLMAAVRLAIAGNAIDMGANSNLMDSDLRNSILHALTMPLIGDRSDFLQDVAQAKHILYLTDNAGEIVFDSLLIEKLEPARVTVAVRGAPVINDATIVDARDVGLYEFVEVMDNGSDAPGTLLDDCSKTFRQRFIEADLILAKGQGNFETLSNTPRPIIFLFQAKCPVIADHAQVPLGTRVMARSRFEKCQYGKKS
ncbi:DUF89 domain-containing protein [Thermodesulfobacteriota bacterium]